MIQYFVVLLGLDMNHLVSSILLNTALGGDFFLILI